MNPHKPDAPRPLEALIKRLGAWVMPKSREMPEADDAPLDRARLPRHVAIIMDGNGRWATRRALPRSAGHHAGTEALRAIIRECDALGIEALTIYAFSTENWRRPEDEVSALMALLLQFFASEIEELHKENVRITILGDVFALPEPQKLAVTNAMDLTRANTGLKLNIALNYGGRAELVRAVVLLSKRAAAEDMNLDALTEADLEDFLYTRGLPDVDLVIRTSGEMRLSNFLPYQTAYAELIFNDLLWPDYDVAAFHADLKTYAGRNRRFGNSQ